MNNGNIIGRLTRDLEFSVTKNQKSIAKGSIAVNDKYNKEKTHFFNFTAFGKTAEVMRDYLRKGSQIGISYSLNHSTWTTQDGQNRSAVDLLVNDFTFTGSRNEGGQSAPSNNVPTQTGPDNSDIESFDFDMSGGDEVPF